MKVKLYFGNENSIKKSGIGRALKHQMKALSLNNISYTVNKSDDDYDILHINTVFPSSPRVLREAKKHNKKIIYHAHSTEEDFKGSFIGSDQFAPTYKKWLISLYSQADAIITPSLYSKRLLESYGLTQKIYAISNGICLEDFSPTLQQITVFKEHFHITNQKVIMSVGWLFERKGFDTFCEIASILSDYLFIWFGDVHLSAPTQKIRKILKNLPKNVILPGYVTGDVIKGAYGYADVFFFPSREETEGIVVLEALAAKKDIVLRDIPVYEDWLQDKIHCYKGKTNDDFVYLIRNLVDKKIPSTGNVGYQVACERELSIIGKELLKVYNEVISL